MLYNHLWHTIHILTHRNRVIASWQGGVTLHGWCIFAYLVSSIARQKVGAVIYSVLKYKEDHFKKLTTKKITTYLFEEAIKQNLWTPTIMAAVLSRDYYRWIPSPMSKQLLLTSLIEETWTLRHINGQVFTKMRMKCLYFMLILFLKWNEIHSGKILIIFPCKKEKKCCKRVSRS